MTDEIEHNSQEIAKNKEGDAAHATQEKDQQAKEDVRNVFSQAGYAIKRVQLGLTRVEGTLRRGYFLVWQVC